MAVTRRDNILLLSFLTKGHTTVKIYMTLEANRLLHKLNTSPLPWITCSPNHCDCTTGLVNAHLPFMPVTFFHPPPFTHLAFYPPPFLSPAFCIVFIFIFSLLSRLRLQAVATTVYINAFHNAMRVNLIFRSSSTRPKIRTFGGTVAWVVGMLGF